MLVLTRKSDESVLLGDNIKITVLGIEDDRVRIGIDAPKSMRIFRQELLTATANVNKEANVGIRQFSLKPPEKENTEEQA